MIKKCQLFLIAPIISLVLLNCVNNTKADNAKNEKVNNTITSTEEGHDDLSSNYKSLDSIQKQLHDIYPKLLQSTVSIECSYSDPATGVLISEDGYVLTAKHVLELSLTGKKLEVCLSDGTSYMADILGQDFSLDYALLKINEKKIFPYSKLGNISNLSKDEALLMIGYSNYPPMGRLGFYKGINNCGFLQATCIMQPGDSGGPIFDLEGNVIGLCSHISERFDQNFYAPVDNIRTNIERLKKGEIISTDSWLNCMSSEVKDPPPYKEEKPFVIKGGKNMLKKVFSNHNSKYRKSIIRIESIKEGIKRKTYASIVNSDGIAVAKSSEVTNDITACFSHDNSNVTCRVVARNKENDIALIKIDNIKDLTPISLDFNGRIKHGDFLTTVTHEENSSKYSGIVSLEYVSITNLGAGYLGAFFKTDENLTVQQLAEDGAAKRGGLKKGDKVIRFNEKPVSNIEDLSALVQKTEPYELVTISILREGKELSKNFEIGQLPIYGYEKEHTADYTKVNFRNANFPVVFMHDMPIHVEDCGTPVINFNEEVVGINIARKDRASSLVIPTYQIKDIISEMLDNTK